MNKSSLNLYSKGKKRKEEGAYKILNAMFVTSAPKIERKVHTNYSILNLGHGILRVQLIPFLSPPNMLNGLLHCINNAFLVSQANFKKNGD